MRRWSHGHSVGVGAILAVALTGHMLWALTVMFALGAACGWFARNLKGAGRKAAGILEERILTERERRAGLRASRRVRLDAARASRDKLEQAYKRGVIEGRLDEGGKTW